MKGFGLYIDLDYVYQMHSQPIKRYFIQFTNNNKYQSNHELLLNNNNSLKIYNNNYHKKSQSRRNSNSYKVFQSLVNQIKQNSNQLQVHVKIQKVLMDVPFSSYRHKCTVIMYEKILAK
ncbi:hypothetical protein DICPUDRAFT_85366 [Dictyostelium purpureum]|uniref:Uncharacterized protein n=1 Tax=Dictyostelium purpureum TaxID=5786 RepID=F1A5H8_DICPU|nr:uncharacterized protein DICPUDRAFT_85366 [Dictyostelium purpureum]EGC28553.1 hypothetical protein DICPUDRAFT_85366 [Dictyostelium purpureum]|eukprot:XP_003294922.1 hypothetical protein DICPUDRAFT_85366 [Dictyostelium purpureum]